MGAELGLPYYAMSPVEKGIIHNAYLYVTLYHVVLSFFSPLAEGWVSSLLAIGAILGALPTGYIADAIGRRYTALAMDIPFFLAWLCLSFGGSAGWLYLGRFLIGKVQAVRD